MHSPELLKGTLQTILLKVLKDHGRMYVPRSFRETAPSTAAPA